MGDVQHCTSNKFNINFLFCSGTAAEKQHLVKPSLIDIKKVPKNA